MPIIKPLEAVAQISHSINNNLISNVVKKTIFELIPNGQFLELKFLVQKLCLLLKCFTYIAKLLADREDPVKKHVRLWIGTI